MKENVDIEVELLIERARRVKTDKSKKGNTPRTTVCRILNYKHKVKIPRNTKKLKSKNIFVNGDFAKPHGTIVRSSGRR